MLQALFSKALQQGPLSRGSREARRQPLADPAQEGPSPPGPYSLTPANDPLPLIVAKVEADARSRVALKRLGYFRVLRAYLRHKREGRDAFHAFGADHLWPTMDFVHDWLKQEARQLVARHGWVFLLTFAATVIAGLAFLGVLVVLG